MKNVFLVLIGSFLSLSPCGWAAAADESAAYDDSEVLFARRVAPLIREKCIACHGEKPDEIEGGFDLRSLESATAGGDSDEPGVVPGKPAESSIYLAAERGEEAFSAMPPKEAEKLNEEQLAWLRDWIKSGARWPSKERQTAIHAKFEEAWSVEDGITVRTSGGLADDWTDRKYDPEGLWAYRPIQKVDFSKEEIARRNAIDRTFRTSADYFRRIFLRRQRVHRPYCFGRIPNQLAT